MDDMNYDGDGIRGTSQGGVGAYVINRDTGRLSYFGMLLQIKTDGGFSFFHALPVGCVRLHALLMNIVEATYSLGPGQFMQGQQQKGKKQNLVVFHSVKDLILITPV